MKEAGYSTEKPLKTTFVIAQGGTGQMLSLPMNEFLQQSFKEIGIEIDFKVVELETLYTAWRKGAANEMNANITSNNIAYVTSDPLYAIVRFFHSGQIAPVILACDADPRRRHGRGRRRGRAVARRRSFFERITFADVELGAAAGARRAARRAGASPRRRSTPPTRRRSRRSPAR